MTTLLQDLRFSLRLLLRAPGFTLIAVITLALGIGINTAIFILFNALNYTHPFPHPEQVVQLYTQDLKNPQQYRAFSYPVYRELRAQCVQFTGIMAHRLTMVGVGAGADTRHTLAALISANYFDVLGVKLIRGRAFTAAEETPTSAAPVVIASHLYWKKTGFNPALVGSTIRVNERPFTVVGITPENFSGTTVLFGPELYFPLSQFDPLTNDSQADAKHTLEDRQAYLLFLVGRLRMGTSITAAQAALSAYAANLEKAFPVAQKNQTFTLAVLPRDGTSSEPPQKKNGLTLVGMLLLGMAGIVLLIASLNLANLLLARGAARRKEFAIRLALGGGRMRIIRQLLTEGFVLSFFGGLLGLLLGVWSSDLLANTLAVILPESVFFSSAVSPVIIAATLGFSVLSTLVFALGPALKLSRGDVITDLKEQAGEDTPRRHRWLPRNPMVVAQIALSLGLLACAGLFSRSAFKAGRADIGLKADHTLIVEADARLGGYDETHTRQIYSEVIHKLRAIPGVQCASIASFVPFGFSSEGAPIRRAGFPLAKDARPASAAEGLAFDSTWNSVGTDYFTTLGLPILRGRAFTESEANSTGAPAVAIIDEGLARELWPAGDALGQRIQYGYDEKDSRSIEVVGIVPPVTFSLFKEKRSAIYVPFAQGFKSPVNFHLRTLANSSVSALTLIDTVRRVVREAAPGMPVFKVRTFRQHLDASGDLWMVQMGATLFSIFGGLALVLAVVGLYGVKAYSVARRTREIGIRMALGAMPGQVQAMILREGLTMILAGAGLGLLLAIGLGRLCASLLYQVGSVDPLAFTIAPAVLILTAMAACYVPARRASRLSPLQALRSE